MDDTFSISEDVGSGRSVVSVSGELDVATAAPLRDQLETTIDRGNDLVVVDLLGVTFIDSTALGVLIAALKRSESAGGTLKIVVSEPRILKIFEITGLTDLFAIVPSLSDATPG